MSNVWLDPPRPGGLARALVRSRADVREIERTPYGDLLPAWSIAPLLERAAALTPSKPAIIVADAADPTRVGRSISYRELAEAVAATARRLRAVSGPGRPVISILTPLVPEAFFALWAGATAGIANPINPFLRIDHVAEIMNAAGTTVLLCGTRSHGAGAWEHVAELGTRVPTLRTVWFLDEAGGGDSFARQLQQADGTHPATESCHDAERTATLLHTGGTTAAPKLVRLTERGQLLNAWCCGAFNGCRAEGVMALGMPYFHVGGAICLSLAAMLFGQTMVIVSPAGYRDPRVISRFWELVEAHGITQTGSTPTTPAALLAAGGSGSAPAGCRYWAGGAALPVQVAREFADRFGVPLCEGWGMTEMQGGMIINPTASEPCLGSIGIPFPYHDARCVQMGSASAENLAPAGQVGVLSVSGPCVTPGYYDDRRTSQLFFESAGDAKRWLNTGDLCTIDEGGHVWLRGRSKDLIIRGGHNIDPLVIEDALLTHPAVMLAAAVGEPHRDKGEVPVAYVQLRPGISVEESELLAHSQSSLSERAAVPREVRILKAMPLTAVGKIFKPALRVDAIQRCVAQVQASVPGASDLSFQVRETGGAIDVVLNGAGKVPEQVERLRAELEHYTFHVRVDSSAAG
jgi:fatty-acyl-CoA synthase